jgi:hypothetical protein
MEGTKIVLDLEQPLVDLAALVVPENPCTKIIIIKKFNSNKIPRNSG